MEPRTTETGASIDSWSWWTAPVPVRYDKEVNGNCTCGVELVEGARFCHKCGRPVDGYDPIAEAEDVPAAPVIEAQATEAPLAPPPLPAPPIGFRNRETIRAALLAVAITFLPSSAIGQISSLFIFVGLLVNGLLGVLLYLRRTGRGMTAIEGARQGWISGLFFFGISFLMSSLVIAASGKDFAEVLREQAKTQGASAPDIAKLFDQPGFFGVWMVAAFVVAFVLVTSLGSIGGILGARLFGSGSKNASQETGSKLG